MFASHTIKLKAIGHVRRVKGNTFFHNSQFYDNIRQKINFCDIVKHIIENI